MPNKSLSDVPANSTSNGTRVSVDHEEYEALKGLRDLYDAVVADLAKASSSNDVLRTTCRAQARRLVELDLVMQHYEKVNGLQSALIDAMRAGNPKLASLEELSEFWRHWSLTTETFLKKNPQQRDEVSKLEPDLFRSWKLWVRDADQANRKFAVAGTRAEVEAQQQMPQGTLQDVMVAQLQDKNAELRSRVRELETELEVRRRSASKVTVR